MTNNKPNLDLLVALGYPSEASELDENLARVAFKEKYIPYVSDPIHFKSPEMAEVYKNDLEGMASTPHFGALLEQRKKNYQDSRDQLTIDQYIGKDSIASRLGVNIPDMSFLLDPKETIGDIEYNAQKLMLDLKKSKEKPTEEQEKTIDKYQALHLVDDLIKTEGYGKFYQEKQGESIDKQLEELNKKYAPKGEKLE